MTKEEEILLEKEAFENIQSLIKNQGKKFNKLNKEGDSVILENENSKYILEKNNENQFDTSYGLRIEKGGKSIKFNRRPTENGSDYSEIVILILDYFEN